MAETPVATAKNTFGDGLLMDFAPDNTQATFLTNALNATFLTMNGNEYALQNDMGNGRVETAYLPEGYVPVGTCEFGGIVYIASYNPITNKSEIGCFPSPERNISSEETGDSVKTISNSNFKDNDTITAMSVKQVLVSKSLNPGDKYIIYVDSTTALEANSKYLSDYGNTDHTHGDFPKIVKLHIVSIEDSGRITYLDSSVKWYGDYYINTCQKTSTSKPDIDSYRNLLSSGYSVFQSKVSGKLAILAELESITSFECTHNVYKTSEQTMPTDKIKVNNYSVFVNIHWETDNDDVNPESIHFLQGEWIGVSKDSGGKYQAWTASSDGVLKENEKYVNTHVSAPSYSFYKDITYKSDLAQGYLIGQDVSYADYKSTYKFSVFKDKIIDGIKNIQKTSCNKITQYFENNLPSPGKYLVDLASIEYKEGEPEYQAASKDKVDASDYKITISPIELPDTVVNNYFKSSVSKNMGGFTIPVTQTLNGTEIDLDISNLVYKYTVIPHMVYGDLTQYAHEGYIDFSKINSGSIELTQWRYFNGENLCTMKLGLDCYEEEGKGIQEVVIDFYDNQGVAASYHLSGKNSYSGVFGINLMLNQIGVLSKIAADGSTIKHKGAAASDSDTDVIEEVNKKYVNDAGTLYSNILYLAKITVKYTTKDILGNYNETDKSSYKTFYRWLWTNTAFNDSYTSVKDFNSLQINLAFDVAPSYTSSLTTQTVDYHPDKAITEKTEEQLSAIVQRVQGNINAKVDVGLQNTYNTFCLYAGDTNLKKINVQCYIANNYIDSPTGNTYKNLSGNVQELAILQPTVDLNGTERFGKKLWEALGETNVNSTEPELWEQSEYYTNQWSVDFNLDTSATQGVEELSYYNYAYESVTDQEAVYRKYNLDTCYNSGIQFNINLFDFSKYCPIYYNKTVNGTIIKPLVSDSSDLDNFNLTESATFYTTDGVWTPYHGTMWTKNRTQGVGWNTSKHLSVFKNQGHNYWLDTSSDTSTIEVDGVTVDILNITSIASGNHEVVGFTQTFGVNGRDLSNYIQPKDPSYLTTYAKQTLPYNNAKYGSDIEGDNNISRDAMQNSTKQLWTYLLADSDSNKRPINIGTYSKEELKQQLVALFSNLYKVSGDGGQLTVQALQDCIYLNNYTSTYTQDVVYKVWTDAEVANDYLLMSTIKYSDYLEAVLKNIDGEINMNNANIKIGGVLKNIPIQLQISYIAPSNQLEDYTSQYILRKCRFSTEAPVQEMISGTYNENTLYVYRKVNNVMTLEPWRSYTPCLSASYGVDDYGTYLTNAHVVDPDTFITTQNIASCEDLEFAKTNSGGRFTLENRTLKLTTNQPEDSVRLVTHDSKDNQDDDMLYYFFSRNEILVPWMAVLTPTNEWK